MGQNWKGFALRVLKMFGEMVGNTPRQIKWMTQAKTETRPPKFLPVFRGRVSDNDSKLVNS